jgi:hypothetical protein
MEKEIVDCFKPPFRFQPDINNENHTRDHATTDAAMNRTATGAEPNNEVAVPKANAQGYKNLHIQPQTF